MTLKSTVLTKKEFSKSELNGKKIIGTIMNVRIPTGGSGDVSVLPMIDPTMHVYEQLDTSSVHLSGFGFDETTVNSGLTLGPAHVDGQLSDFHDTKVDILYAGVANETSPVGLGFGTVQLVDKVIENFTLKTIQLTITDIESLTSERTLLFSVTYKTDVSSSDLRAVWAKLKISLQQPTTETVQVIWSLEDQTI